MQCLTTVGGNLQWTSKVENQSENRPIPCVITVTPSPVDSNIVYLTTGMNVISTPSLGQGMQSVTNPASLGSTVQIPATFNPQVTGNTPSSQERSQIPTTAPSEVKPSRPEEKKDLANPNTIIPPASDFSLKCPSEQEIVNKIQAAYVAQKFSFDFICEDSEELKVLTATLRKLKYNVTQGPCYQVPWKDTSRRPLNVNVFW